MIMKRRMFGNSTSENKSDAVMDERFYYNVAEAMPENLPRPRKKLTEDGEEIPIISIICDGVEL